MSFYEYYYIDGVVESNFHEERIKIQNFSIVSYPFFKSWPPFYEMHVLVSEEYSAGIDQNNILVWHQTYDIVLSLPPLFPLESLFRRSHGPSNRLINRYDRSMVFG